MFEEHDIGWLLREHSLMLMYFQVQHAAENGDQTVATRSNMFFV